MTLDDELKNLDSKKTNVENFSILIQLFANLYNDFQSAKKSGVSFESSKKEDLRNLILFMKQFLPNLIGSLGKELVDKLTSSINAIMDISAIRSFDDSAYMNILDSLCSDVEKAKNQVDEILMSVDYQNKFCLGKFYLLEGNTVEDIQYKLKTLKESIKNSGYIDSRHKDRLLRRLQNVMIELSRELNNYRLMPVGSCSLR